MENSIVIKNKTIIEFYRENSNLDIVSMNLIFIDILKNLSSNLTNTMNSTVISKILSIVSDIDKNVNSFKSEIIYNFNDKLNQVKKDYIEDLKLQFNNNIQLNNDKISNMIDKNADTILTKTISVINDIIPRSQDKNYTLLENCIKSYCSLIEKDTKQLLETKTKENDNKVILDNIEKNFMMMVNSIQTPIFNLIKTTEEKTVDGFQKVNNEFLQQKVFHEKLTNELSDFLNKYKNNSSVKGLTSENELYYMLQSIFPSDELIRVSSETACCDFKVNRKTKDKPTILFENKDYNRNVSTDEVNKFERDLQLQKHHGIFISQKTPITYKDNFQIDIINGLIHVYIPNANYDIEKLKIAVDIIDNLSTKLILIENSTEDNLYLTNKKELEELSFEYRIYANQKIEIQETINKMSKQLLEQLDKLQLPKFHNILIKLGVIETAQLTCEFCGFEGKNKASIAAHIRCCKLNNKNNNFNNIVLTNVSINPDISSNIKDSLNNIEITNSTTNEKKPESTKKIKKGGNQ